MSATIATSESGTRVRSPVSAANAITAIAVAAFAACCELVALFVVLCSSRRRRLVLRFSLPSCSCSCSCAGSCSCGGLYFGQPAVLARWLRSLRLFSERWPLCGCPPTRRRRRITLHGHSRRSTKSLATGTAPQSGGTIWAAEHVLSLSVVRWKKSQRSSVSPRAGNAAEHPAIAGPCRFEGNHFSVLDRRRSGLFCSGEERREREREREREGERRTRRSNNVSARN